MPKENKKKQQEEPQPPVNTTPNHPWLKQVPELQDGKRFPSMPPAEAAKLFDDFVAGGKEAVLTVIDEIGEVDDGKDWKSRFVLKAAATHVNGKDRQADARKLEKIYADELTDKRSVGARTFLVMQLECFGTEACTKAVAEQLKTEDDILIAAAARTLTAIGKPAEKALRKVHGQVSGKAQDAIDHALKQIES